ncbi:MAG: peptidyl-alpha-hydroxyglycine alpha-amidating lyase family protein [Dehalococcoidales bacterium]
MRYGAGKYTYELVDGWAKYPEGGSFLDVCGLSIDSQDRVYVLNRSDNPVMVFDREGSLVTSWGQGFFQRAHGSCAGSDGSVFCTDDGHHTVSKFTPEGKLLMELGNKDRPSDTGFTHTPGTSMTSCLHTITQSGPPFNRPTGVALSDAGDIYVSDGYGNARIHRFSPDGELLLSWGEPGYDPGQFSLPHSVWVDQEGQVWVPDRENNRIQIFTADGEFLKQWTDLKRPTDIYMDSRETVYVSELTQRVSIFNKDGELLARWGSTEEEDKEKALFHAPHAIAVDSRGDIYVGEVSKTFAKIDKGSRTVQKFARKT